MLEGDDELVTPTVLCVSAIGQYAAQDRGRVSHHAVELTDGWYAVEATADGLLSQVIRSGGLRVGDKVLLAGGVLQGHCPAPPLEFRANNVGAASEMRTTPELRYNFTRLARWDMQLGRSRGAKGIPFCLPLCSVRAGGGPVMELVASVRSVSEMRFVRRTSPACARTRADAPISSLAQVLCEGSRHDYSRRGRARRS